MEVLLQSPGTQIPEYGESWVSQQGLLPKLGEAGLDLGMVTAILPIRALFVLIVRRVPISAYFDDSFVLWTSVH